MEPAASQDFDPADVGSRSISDVALRHSITSSARKMSVGGTARPCALAVLAFIVKMYFIGI